MSDDIMAALFVAGFPGTREGGFIGRQPMASGGFSAVYGIVLLPMEAWMGS